MSKLFSDVVLEVEMRVKAESVLRWLKMGVSPERIAEGENLPVEAVRLMAGIKAKPDCDACGKASCRYREYFKTHNG